jgi:hypothetical protein
MRMYFKTTGKSIYILLCWVIFSTNKSFSQDHLSLFYEEFNVFFSPSKCYDTINFNLKGKYLGYKLRLYLKDFNGKAYFQLFDKKNELRIAGNFDNAIDTLKKYKFGKYLGESKDIVKYDVLAVKFLYPLKAGEWIYYEGDGKRKISRNVTYIYTTN